MSISLEDYSTFQFMLARSSIARKITSRCTSFVFYDGPKHETSRSIICCGDINTFNYYICCLLVLPSHILGMSQWISSEDKSSTARKPGDELRRFHYSYYCGFLSVDSRHIRVDDKGGSGCDDFRLVEYMECCIPVWMLSQAMFLSGSAIVAFGMQRSGLCFSDDTSLSKALVIVFVTFHVILACTGVSSIACSTELKREAI